MVNRRNHQLLMVGMCFAATSGEVLFGKPAEATKNDCSANEHVVSVKDAHDVAIKKGEIASRVWKINHDIMAAKDLCVMPRPSAMPSTTERQPVVGDWVRTKNAPSNHLVCLPLRRKKAEDSATCGWHMRPDERVKVVAIDQKGNFRLASPVDDRQSIWTPWKNWRYDETVLTGILEDVTNLKADCEKMVFAAYTSQADIKVTSQEIQELREKGDHMDKLHQDLQEKFATAQNRLEDIYILKRRYDQQCR